VIIPACILLVAGATGISLALGAPLGELLVAIVGVPLFLGWWAWWLMRLDQPTRRPAPPSRPIRGQIVVTRVPQTPRPPALPYGDVPPLALPAPRLRVLHGRRDETAS
jgi:hypothetical protein